MASILHRGVLALSDEAAEAGSLAGHSFLRDLPPHVRELGCEDSFETKSRFSMQDLREFLMAYCAMFVAVTTFIS